MRQEMGNEFNRYVPAVPVTTFDKFIHLTLPLLIGLWPLACPRGERRHGDGPHGHGGAALPTSNGS